MNSIYQPVLFRLVDLPRLWPNLWPLASPPSLYHISWSPDLPPGLLTGLLPHLVHLSPPSPPCSESQPPVTPLPTNNFHRSSDRLQSPTLSWWPAPPPLTPACLWTPAPMSPWPSGSSCRARWVKNGISRICYLPQFYGGHLYLLPCGQSFKQFMIFYGHVLKHHHHQFIKPKPFFRLSSIYFYFAQIHLFSFKQIEWLHYHMQTVFKWNSNPFQYLIFCWNFIILHHLSIKEEITSIINKLLQNYFREKYSRLKIFSGSWKHNWKERRHCEKI